MSSLGSRLRQILEEKNLKQKDLALNTGIPQSNINCYLTGKRNPKLESIKRICDFLWVQENWLLTGEGPKTVKEGKQNSPKAGIDYNDIEQYDPDSEPKINAEEVEMLKEVIAAHLRTIAAKDELIESLKREIADLRLKVRGNGDIKKRQA